MKILSNGRFWGSGAKIEHDIRERIIKLLRSSDLPMRTIAQRFGIWHRLGKRHRNALRKHPPQRLLPRTQLLTERFGITSEG